jgi:serine/threonine-protein kinase
MGIVYLARHALLRRKTVVKLINEDASPEAVNRFEREVQLTSQLTHPNTIAVYDFGRTAEGTFYYAMEHLEGSDLQRMVSTTGSLPPARVIHVLRQVCGALEEAHAAGLIHRDIKPSNLFLCPRRGTTDAIKVLDFGLAKELVADPRSVSLTMADGVLGTPLYMSPELVLPENEPDARSDLYALGAVAYYLLTGTPLFTGTSAVAVLLQHVTAAPVPPSQRGAGSIPEDLERVVLRCLEKTPEARFPNARALREALDACADAHAWSEGDAVAWWQERGKPLLASKPRGALTHADAPTITIDLAREPDGIRTGAIGKSLVRV